MVEVVSRFKSAAKQKETLKKVAAGEIDVIVGTHRLLSKDVKFKDLGLVIIDEEQRFGVEDKERLKHLRGGSRPHDDRDADPQTSSRQLGIREISISNAAAQRLPVETRIIRWDDQLAGTRFSRDGRGGPSTSSTIAFTHSRSRGEVG